MKKVKSLEVPISWSSTSGRTSFQAIPTLILGTFLLLTLTSCSILPFEITWKENYWGDSKETPAPALADGSSRSSEAAAVLESQASPGSQAAADTTAPGALANPTNPDISTNAAAAKPAPDGMEEIAFGEAADTAPSELVPADAAPDQSAQEPAPSEPDATVGAIELVWKVPETPVDGFVLRHGIARQQLKSELKVPIGQLEQYEDSAHGRVFRYLLQGVAQDQVVFVSISAYTGSNVSEPSAVFEVRP